MARQKVFVTGANGTLGQDLLARLALFDQFDLVGADRTRLNLLWDETTLKSALDELNPDIVINPAAFTQVDAAEAERETAMTVNGIAPGILAQWTQEKNRYLIHISTDYVFEGTKGALYLPSDPTHPINYYGVSKRAGEEAILQNAPGQSAVVRTSWLFGPGARNFVPFVLQAAQQQKPIRIAMDQWGTPTWTGNLCKMILQVMEERWTGVFHGCSTGMTTRYEQALHLCKAIGMPTDFMTPVPTEAFGFPARRPENTAMQSSFDCALNWEDATETFLKTQGLLPSHV